MKVLIVAQGQQTRLAGHIDRPKQWIPLPYGRLPVTVPTPILARTLLQLRHLGVGEAHVIATDELTKHAFAKGSAGWVKMSHWRKLPDPGNNLLAGLRQLVTGEDTFQTDTTVLLGDVVYSWATLEVLLRRRRPANHDGKYDAPVLFAGTPKVTAREGELWGVTWDAADGVDRVIGSLGRIKDPPFPEYQCGQLRKLLWEIQKAEVLPEADVADPFVAHPTAPWYHPTEDYTADIDTPRDLERLPELGRAAWDDDQRELHARMAAL